MKQLNNVQIIRDPAKRELWDQLGELLHYAHQPGGEAGYVAAIRAARRFTPGKLYNPWVNFAEMQPAWVTHKVLDELTDPNSAHKGYLPHFLGAFHQSAGRPTEPDLIDRLSRLALYHGQHHLLEEFDKWRHESMNRGYYPHDKHHSGLKAAANFWYDYEDKVRPEHFATLESLHSGRPETVVNHRRESGSSDKYMHVIDHLPAYAMETQRRLLKEHDRGSPMVRIWPGWKLNERIHGPPSTEYDNDTNYIYLSRGVGGGYANTIRRKIGLDPESGTTQAHNLNHPVARFSSWTTGTNVAQQFARNRGFMSNRNKHEGKGITLHAWMPLHQVLHAGFLDVVPGQTHRHKGEREVILHHPKRRVNIKTSDIAYEVQQPGATTSGFYRAEPPKNATDAQAVKDSHRWG